MKDFVALYTNNKLGIGIASLYLQLLQNILQVADDLWFDSNFSRALMGRESHWYLCDYIENVSEMVKMK